MKKYLIASAAAMLFSAALSAQPYIINQDDKDRAASIVSQMTLDEKIEFISGKDDGFHTYGIERLGIPVVRMADARWHRSPKHRTASAPYC